MTPTEAKLKFNGLGPIEKHMVDWGPLLARGNYPQCFNMSLVLLLQINFVNERRAAELRDAAAAVAPVESKGGRERNRKTMPEFLSTVFFLFQISPSETPKTEGRRGK